MMKIIIKPYRMTTLNSDGDGDFWTSSGDGFLIEIDPSFGVRVFGASFAIEIGTETATTSLTSSKLMKISSENDDGGGACVTSYAMSCARLETRLKQLQLWQVSREW